MASTYVTEPPTKGKVVLKTSVGELEIELWPKEAPKAVRNFVQLCLEGFYHGTVFHRIIKDFMAQGGDPTGTGQGSDSIYDGQPFKDEFHSRLRFSHRGLVACANQNEPDTNSCQFFITLDACDFLTRKNTIFGRVVGDTIYNVVRMGELEVDENDRPVDPPVITDVEVLWNPFEDIVPRTTIEERMAKAQTAKKPKKRKGKKDLNLLSFGDDAAEDEAELTGLAGQARIKSAHDAIEDARLLRDDDAEAQRIREGEEEEHARRTARNKVLEKLNRQKGEEERGLADKLKAKVEAERAAKRERGEAEGGAVPPGSEDAEEHEAAPGAADEPSEQQRKKQRQKEFRQQLREREDDLADKRGAAPRRASKQVENSELLTDWQRNRAEYKQRKRLTGSREKETLAKLNMFKAKMSGSAPAPKAGSHAGGEPSPSTGAPADSAGYSGKVRDDIDHRMLMPAAWRVDDYLSIDDEDDNLLDLKSHKLVFSKQQKDEMSRTENVDDYVVLDPLVEKQKEKFNKVQQKNKKRATEWAGRSVT
mmetsp:Transcript_27700/g.71898  ORF Transcript_27700/g.71898 Transcript_27700/m.71898 type:complete len:535 (+) Transcript_27700:245-1849(+)|eukprot:jgi/Tetstr1/432637/TSEL_022005.t1